MILILLYLMKNFMPRANHYGVVLGDDEETKVEETLLNKYQLMEHLVQ